MTAAAQVCDPEIFYDIDPENRTNCENCTRNLTRMMNSVWHVFSMCEHLFAFEHCENMFRSVVTEDGVCFTYNRLRVYRQEENFEIDYLDNEWTLEGGYKNNSGQLDGFPRKGTQLPFTGTFQVHKGWINRICKGSIQGFKVFLHLPNEVPQMSKQFYLVPNQHIVSLRVIPRMITTVPELREVSVDKRQCFFSDERDLRFFISYTQNNCELECVANLTIKICGCQRFYMPSELKVESFLEIKKKNVPEITGVKLCGISDISCYQNVIQQNVEQNMKEAHLSDCKCLPACTSISYDTEINQVFILDEAINFNRNDSEYIKTFR
jgi:acid-sensing ion channel, other